MIKTIFFCILYFVNLPCMHFVLFVFYLIRENTKRAIINPGEGQNDKMQKKCTCDKIQNIINNVEFANSLFCVTFNMSDEYIK